MQNVKLSVDIQKIAEKNNSVDIVAEMPEEQKEDLRQTAQKYMNSSIEELTSAIGNKLPKGSTITFRDKGYQLQITAY